ncbi:leukemia inhibitory factor receptor [Polymixia lowei]
MEADWKLPKPNLTRLQAINERQTLAVSWAVDHSDLLGENDHYEIQIGRTENLTIIHSYNVSVQPVGEDGVYTWEWTSTLPLQCADHSVRIRRFYNRSVPSVWSQWMTNNGSQKLVDTEKTTRIFPWQQVLKEGTSAMLCCVPPRGVHVTGMTFYVVPGLEEYHISVVVSNQLGEEAESYSFNISERVFPVPEWRRVSPGVMDTDVSWILQGNLSGVALLCQVVTNPETTTTVTCGSAGGHCEGRLEHLLPNTRYSARVRCAVKGKLWGDWVQPVSFATYPLVTLDMWRRVKQLPHSFNLRNVTLLWTTHVPGLAATAVIQGYMIQWWQGGQNGTMWEDSGQTQAEISIGPGKCNITVQAVLQTFLQAGSSVPAHITVPQDRAKGLANVFCCLPEHLLAEQRVTSSSDGGFNLSWVEQDHATCGYTVEWCSLGNGVPCTLRWAKVAEGNNSLFLPPGNFKIGCRYTFYIYGCTESGDKLLEIQTGYAQELKAVLSPSLVEPVKRTSSSVILQWRYNEDDQAHPGFITGYVVTVQEVGLERSPGQIPKLLNVSVMDPRRKSVTVEGLQENKEYIFSLSALSSGGAGPPTTITIRTAANYSVLLAKILAPLLLLLACTALLWCQRKTLHDGLKGIFVYPAGMNIKPFELDSFLHETSERLASQTVEECVTCDIKILKAKPPVCESSTFPSFQVDYSAQSPVFQRETMFVLNRFYYGTVGGNFSEHVTTEVTTEGIGDIISSQSSDCLRRSLSVSEGYISCDVLK